MFGQAANCTNCKLLASQVFYNSKKERICSNCIQGEYDRSCENLKKAYDDLYDSTQKNKELEDSVSSLSQKVELYTGILAQIQNFTQLVK